MGGWYELEKGQRREAALRRLDVGRGKMRMALGWGEYERHALSRNMAQTRGKGRITGADVSAEVEETQSASL
jgi:hypothetical protein